MGVEEHRFLGFGVIIPFPQGLQVDGAELPLFQWVGFASVKSPELFQSADGEPIFHESDAAVDDHPLKRGTLAEEFEIFRGSAEFHDSLDAGAVVPGAVKEDHFALGWEVFDISLKIPLAHFAFGGFLQSDYMSGPRIQVLHKALNCSSFSGGIASFEKNEDSLACAFNPLLNLEEFGL